MSVKVAVASSDGKYVNQHFGKAQNFLIFEVKEDGLYEFIEVRETAARCGGSDELKKKTLDMLSDCKLLLVTQIGPGAINKLIAQGTKPLVMPMFIEDALKELSALYKSW